MAKFADHMEKITEGVTEGFQKIGDGVVTGYKQIEEGVVEGFSGITEKMSGVMLNEDGTMKTGKMGEAVAGAYKKVENAFVSTFMAKEGETVDEAKARVVGQQKTCEEKLRADAEKRAAGQKARIEASLEVSRNAGKIDR